MNLPFFIARRYFLSTRKKNFINIISVVSMLCIATGVAFLFVVLSVFNGITHMVRSVYSATDPEIKIEAVKGKSFSMTDSLRSAIQSVDGVEVASEVIEDYVYIRYKQPNVIVQDETDEFEQHYAPIKDQAEMVVTMKGVTNNFAQQNRVDDHMSDGEMKFRINNMHAVVVGKGVQNTLSISLNNEFVPLQIFYVKNQKGNTYNPTNLYTQEVAMPVGVFSIVKEYDENYIIVPIALAKNLMNYGDRLTSIEVKVKEGLDARTVQADLKNKLGNSFKVLTNEEQHQDIIRILKIENLIVGIIASILIIILSVNVYFALQMLVIDKKKDISVLSALGASPSLIRNIFLSEAFIISGYGTLIGLAVGATLCWLQDNLGLVGTGLQTAIMLAYPVKIKWLDFVLILAIMAAITSFIAWLPARIAAKSVEARAL